MLIIGVSIRIGEDRVDSDHDALTRVLRAQLTAVHQQFVHILALRHWGLVDTANRILEIDKIDFPIAMKIIDYMVASGRAVNLVSEPFTPGSCEARILAAELAVDQCLHSALQAVKLPSSPVSNLIAEALAPRRSYADWLSDRIAKSENQAPNETRLPHGLEEVFSFSIVLIEQSMVHAFVHWHHGDKANADAAWATSGAAMMHATQTVRWLAARGAVPLAKNLPRLRISGLPNKAVEFDRLLVRSFERCLSTLSKRADEDLRDLYDPVWSFAKRYTEWEPGENHPAKGTNPPAFQSFEKTLTKFVWA